MMRFRALLSGLLLSTFGVLGAAADQVLPQFRIDNDNHVVAPRGPVLGRWQSNKFISTPDIIQIQSAGSTGPVDGTTVTPNSSAGANTAAGAIARKQDGSSVLTGIASGVFPAPNFGTYTTPYLPAFVKIGNFPNNAVPGGYIVGLSSAISGAVTIDETPGVNNTRAGWSAGVAGFAQSKNATSTQQGAAGVIGSAICSVDGASCWGANIFAGNLTDYAEPQTNKGKNNTNIWIIEGDMNIKAKSDGTRPGGNALGLDLVGNSDVQPLGYFRAVNIQSAGLYSNSPWKEGVHFNAAAVNDGIVFDPAATTGDALKIGPKSASAASGAQTITMTARKSDGTLLTNAFLTDTFGNLIFLPPAGGGTVLSNSNLTTVLVAGDAGLLVNVDGTTKVVSVGAADSCGTGYKCLRVPN